VRLGHGGLLMLEYQKSSAAAPKPRNWLGLEYLAHADHVDAENHQPTHKPLNTHSPNKNIASRSL